MSSSGLPGQIGGVFYGTALYDLGDKRLIPMRDLGNSSNTYRKISVNKVVNIPEKYTMFYQNTPQQPMDDVEEDFHRFEEISMVSGKVKAYLPLGKFDAHPQYLLGLGIENMAESPARVFANDLQLLPEVGQTAIVLPGGSGIICSGPLNGNSLQYSETLYPVFSLKSGIVMDGEVMTLTVEVDHIIDNTDPDNIKVSGVNFFLSCS